jgi:O-antigen/teichoic acid export membrane protein
MFKRILKTLAALAAGHGIQTITQLLIPPAFIAAYGVKGYGEWLALSAAVGYLSTLDFGLQTYVLNELTGLYHRKEMDQFHRVQSVGLWLMLMFVGGGAVVACGAFFLPVAQILKISGPPMAVSWTVFWLALQVLAGIPLGQILGIYRTFGQAHRGVMWGNAYRILLLAVTIILAWLHAAFWVLAAGQVLTILTILLVVTLSLRWSNPEVHPRLDYWDTKLAGQILRASAFFGLFLLNNFLVYQAPVLMLQRFLGSEVVVVFGVARTLFSFVRQGAGLVQQSIAPEITRLYGVGDKEKLVRLYVLFERVVLTVVLIVNAGLLLMAPMLLKFWLKRPEFFNLSVFVLVMLISIVSSLKEYKIYFQYTTNNHVRPGLVTFLSYVLMILVSAPATGWFGLRGFLMLWLSVELIQIGFLHYYNAQVFGWRREVTLQPTLRLGFALLVLLVVVFSSQSFLRSQNYLLQCAAAVSAMILLAGVSYFLFGFRELHHEWSRYLPRVGNQARVAV